VPGIDGAADPAFPLDADAPCIDGVTRRYDSLLAKRRGHGKHGLMNAHFDHPRIFRARSVADPVRDETIGRIGRRNLVAGDKLSTRSFSLPFNVGRAPAASG
jgi:hypothetical protein